MDIQAATNGIRKALINMASKPMFINKQYAKDLLLQFDATINVVASSETAIKEHLERQKDKTAVSFHSADSVLNVRKSGQFGDVPKGSVAVVPVFGAMMRDDYCTLAEGNIAGTRSFERLIERLDANENVEGIVFHVNTPGGEAFGNESLSKAIQNSNTPTVVFFEMMASAGVFAFQGADEIYAAEKNSMWGSIGTYITLVNDDEFWKQNGIEFIEIYASDSTEKNIEFREAKEGNQEPMLDLLDSLNSNFIKEVKKSTPGLIDDGSVFKGKLYTALEARKIKAIDGIKDLNYAISRARYLSRHHDKRKKKRKNYNSQNQFDMAKNEKEQAGWFQRFFGSNTSVEEADNKIEAAQQKIEEIESENKKLKASAMENEETIKSLQKENEELKNSANSGDAKFSELEENNASLNQKVSELEEQLNQSNSDLEEMQNQNKELAEQNEKLISHNKELGGPGNAATPKGDADDQEHKHTASLDNSQSTDAAYQQVLEKMEQNKKKKQ